MELITCTVCGSINKYHEGDTKAVCKECGAKLNIPQSASSALGDERAYTLLNKAYSLLEKGEWESADSCCNEVLELDSQCAEAYLAKLMAELKVQKKAELANVEQPFDSSNNYRYALWFGDDELAAELNGYVEKIKTRNENNRLSALYQEAMEQMDSAFTEQNYYDAADLFEKIGDFKDSRELATECREEAEVLQKDKIYDSAKFAMQSGNSHDYKKAIKDFKKILGWRDADKLLEECRSKEAEIEDNITKRARLAQEKAWERRRIAARKAKRRRKILLFAGLPTVCLIAVLSVLYVTYFSPLEQYNKALADIESGNMAEAYEALTSLENFKDSEQKAKEIYKEYKSEKIKVAEVGDIIQLGSYEQDGNEADGTEDIEWLVLEKQKDRLLVTSKFALDCQPYNTEVADITWEKCTLRKWLNDSFFDSAFNEQEQKLIVTSTVSADKNPKYETTPGKATKDKVFLLSIKEVNRYMKSDEARLCKATPYAKAKGAFTSSNYSRATEPTCWWFLRSPGFEQSYVAYVHYNGSVGYFGGEITSNISSVRPAMWLKFD